MKKRFHINRVSSNINKVTPKGKYIPPMIEEINVGDIGIKARTNSACLADCDCFNLCPSCIIKSLNEMFCDNQLDVNELKHYCKNYSCE